MSKQKAHKYDKLCKDLLREYQYRYDDSLSVWDKPIVAYRAYYRAEKHG
jgi:hypothetical protein